MKLFSKTILTTLLFAIFSGSVFAAEHKVAIQGMAFSPAELTVAVGDTVVFTNQDGAPHSGTANDTSFDTGILSKGESGTTTLTKAGTLDYFCVVHPMMKGKIIVK